jgi:hypothetical protein
VDTFNLRYRIRRTSGSALGSVSLNGPSGGWISGSPTFTSGFVTNQTGNTSPGSPGVWPQSEINGLTVQIRSGSSAGTYQVSAVDLVCNTIQTAPIEDVAPVISGTAVSGSVLSVSDGSWTYGTGAYTYQWRSNGGNIPGATSNTYLLTSSEVGTTVDCVVTATGYNSTSSSDTASGVSVTAPVAAGNPIRMMI